MIFLMISAVEDDFEREFISGIYKKYYSAMLAKAKTLLPNDEDAKELVHDVFADLIRRVDSVMAVEKTKLPAYLFSAVRFSALNFRKKEQRMKFFSDEEDAMEHLEDPAPLPEEVFIRSETAERLKKALERIPEKYRSLLEFRYILGLSDSEIARKLKIPEGTVRSALSRARKKAFFAINEEDEFCD